MLGSIVGPAVVGETDTDAVGVDVNVVGEEVEDDGSGLAPPPHAESRIEAARIATELFLTLPPTVMSCPPAALVFSADQPTPAPV